MKKKKDSRRIENDMTTNRQYDRKVYPLTANLICITHTHDEYTYAVTESIRENDAFKEIFSHPLI